MFIYNVTVMVKWSIHDGWVKWMQEKHIPDVMATGCFEKFQFVRLLDTDETEGPTYATQYYAASKADYNRYLAQHAQVLRKDGTDTWGDNFVGFRSLMQVVN
ncbi:MAG: hypothetical protein RIR90_1635 [Bacteroidota bacterium]|jgi:hypothetical protein